MQPTHDEDANYEVDNPAVKATLRAIAAKVGAGLPPDGRWGFALWIFEFGPGGALFYISSADRAGTINTVREWIAKQEPLEGEVNPEHRTTKGMRREWHKLVAVLLHKYRGVFGDEVVITGEDLAPLAGGDMTVAVLDRADGLHVRLVGPDEALRLAAQERDRIKQEGP